jgi:hypothetical protein
MWINAKLFGPANVSALASSICYGRVLWVNKIALLVRIPNYSSRKRHRRKQKIVGLVPVWLTLL